jgi:hypothetical protein
MAIAARPAAGDRDGHLSCVPDDYCFDGHHPAAHGGVQQDVHRRPTTDVSRQWPSNCRLATPSTSRSGNTFCTPRRAPRWNLA